MRNSIRWTLLPRSAQFLLLLLLGFVELRLGLYSHVTGGSFDQAPMLQVRQSAGAFLVLFMGLVRRLSCAEVSSGAAPEISPVAGAEPLDESRSAATGAGDVYLAGRDAYRRRVGAGVNALWR